MYGHCSEACCSVHDRYEEACGGREEDHRGDNCNEDHRREVGHEAGSQGSGEACDSSGSQACCEGRPEGDRSSEDHGCCQAGGEDGRYREACSKGSGEARNEGRSEGDRGPQDHRGWEACCEDDDCGEAGRQGHDCREDRHEARCQEARRDQDHGGCEAGREEASREARSSRCCSPRSGGREEVALDPQGCSGRPPSRGPFCVRWHLHPNPDVRGVTGDSATIRSPATPVAIALGERSYLAPPLSSPLQHT